MDKWFDDSSATLQTFLNLSQSSSVDNASTVLTSPHLSQQQQQCHVSEEEPNANSCEEGGDPFSFFDFSHVNNEDEEESNNKSQTVPQQQRDDNIDTTDIKADTQEGDLQEEDHPLCWLSQFDVSIPLSHLIYFETALFNKSHQEEQQQQQYVCKDESLSHSRDTSSFSCGSQNNNHNKDRLIRYSFELVVVPNNDTTSESDSNSKKKIRRGRILSAGNGKGSGGGGSGCIIVELLRNDNGTSSEEDPLSACSGSFCPSPPDSIAVKLAFTKPQTKVASTQPSQEEKDSEEKGLNAEHRLLFSLLKEVSVHASLPASPYILPCYGGGIICLEQSGMQNICTPYLHVEAKCSGENTSLCNDARKSELLSSVCMVFLAMELAAETLSQHISRLSEGNKTNHTETTNHQQQQQSQLSQDEAEKVLSQIATGLSIVHHFKIVHADVKPQNIFRRQKRNYNSKHDSDCFCIADFGCASVIACDTHTHSQCEVESFQLQTTSSSTPDAKDHFVLEDAFPGTVIYMAPEAAAGFQPRSTQSDMWSVGILSVWLVTGEVPWAPMERQHPSILLYHLRSSFQQFRQQQSVLLLSETRSSNKLEEKELFLFSPMLEKLNEKVELKAVTVEYANMVKQCLVWDWEKRFSVIQLLRMLQK